jgi:hypothetical protein
VYENCGVICPTSTATKTPTPTKTPNFTPSNSGGPVAAREPKPPPTPTSTPIKENCINCSKYTFVSKTSSGLLGWTNCDGTQGYYRLFQANRPYVIDCAKNDSLVQLSGPTSGIGTWSADTICSAPCPSPTKTPTNTPTPTRVKYYFTSFVSGDTGGEFFVRRDSNSEIVLDVFTNNTNKVSSIQTTEGNYTIIGKNLKPSGTNNVKIVINGFTNGSSVPVELYRNNNIPNDSEISFPVSLTKTGYTEINIVFSVNIVAPTPTPTKTSTPTITPTITPSSTPIQYSINYNLCNVPGGELTITRNSDGLDILDVNTNSGFKSGTLNVLEGSYTITGKNLNIRGTSYVNYRVCDYSQFASGGRNIYPDNGITPPFKITPGNEFSYTINLTKNGYYAIRVNLCVNELPVNCSAPPAPTPSVTPTITPTISLTPTITPTISLTPTKTVTPSITPTKTVTSSITPTKTVTPTKTPTPTPTRLNALPCNVNNVADYIGNSKYVTLGTLSGIVTLISNVDCAMYTIYYPPIVNPANIVTYLEVSDNVYTEDRRGVVTNNGVNFYYNYIPYNGDTVLINYGQSCLPVATIFPNYSGFEYPNPQNLPININFRALNIATDNLYNVCSNVVVSFKVYYKDNQSVNKFVFGTVTIPKTYSISNNYTITNLTTLIYVEILTVTPSDDSCYIYEIPTFC